MNELRVVIDTSSLISYAITRGSIMRRIMFAWEQNEFDLLLSSVLEAELLDVLARPKIRSRSRNRSARLLEELSKFAVIIPEHPRFLDVCRDAKDDMFLGCAVTGMAHYLVSSDNDLLILRRYEDVCILNPGQFLAALQLARLSVEQIQKQYNADTLQTIRNNLCLEKETLAKLDAIL
jgi:putative PIN family toxin of toxin-antitoxin system